MTMMMIAFITINSGLVPLIENYIRAQNCLIDSFALSCSFQSRVLNYYL